MTVVNFITGIFIGAFAGFVIAGLCWAGKEDNTKCK